MEPSLYELVPKDPVKNAEFRIRLLEWCNEGDRDQRFRRRQMVWRACKRDILFWINAFCWLVEPRSGRKFPWVTYPFQDDAIRSLCQAVDNAMNEKADDAIQSKSRDMGASWMCVAVCRWYAGFRKNFSALMLSRKADLVESEDPKSLFYKVDFLDRTQPKWLLPNIKRKEMFWRNDDMDSFLKGDSTNEFAGVADRATVILLDEFSLMERQSKIWMGTRDVTWCRIANFTMKPWATTANELTEKKGMRQIRLHWTLHPEKVRGLYQFDKQAGSIVVRDKSYRFPDDYLFIKDGKQRSPWYDREEARCKDKVEMETEVDMIAVGGSVAFFDHDALKRIRETVVRKALYRAEIFCRSDRWFEPMLDTSVADGRLRFWCPLIAGHRPSSAEYVVGADISAGAGASNSVLAVWSKRRGDRVADYICNRTDPREFAEKAVLLSWLFTDHAGNPAYLKWEGNGGPGQSFGDRVVELGFRNFYLHRNEKSLSKKISDTPGWYSSSGSKEQVLRDYAVALRDGRATNFCEEAIDECRYYITNERGIPEHSKLAASENPLDQENNHGDCVIADAMAWSECQVADVNKLLSHDKIVEDWSLSTPEGRRRFHEEKERKGKRVAWYDKGPYRRPYR